MGNESCGIVLCNGFASKENNGHFATKENAGHFMTKRK